MQKFFSQVTGKTGLHSEDRENIGQSIIELDLGTSSLDDKSRKFMELTDQIHRIGKEYHRAINSFLSFTGENIDFGLASTSASAIHGNWFTETRKGLEIFGIEVPLSRRERAVLLAFCKSSQTEMSKMDILESWEGWSRSLDHNDVKKENNIWSTARSCILDINSELRNAFMLSTDQVPISGTGGKRRLDRRLLKNAAEKLRSVSQLV